MKAVTWTGPRQMEYGDVALPQPDEDEVLVRVEAAGICGSELSGYLGHNSLRVPPLVMGHEFAGSVVEVGRSVVQLHEGDAVVVNPLVTCGDCTMCRRGQENLCLARELIGVHRPGAFAEYVAVPAANCIRLPEGLTSQHAFLAEPLACSVRATRLGNVGPGSNVVILGAGAIGLLAIKAVEVAGGRVLLAVEINPGRLALAEEWGAQATVDARAEDPALAARTLTSDLGADVVIDAVGSAATRKTAIEALRPGGVAVFVGLHEAESLLAANHLIRSEITLKGSFAYTGDDFAGAVSMLAAGDVPSSGAWLAERSLAACDSSFVELIDGRPPFAKIVLRPSQE